MTRARSGSAATSVSSVGPRMHDYRFPGGGTAGITQFRPGLLGHPTGPAAPAPAVTTLDGSDSELPAVASTDLLVTSAPTAVATSPMAVPTSAHAHGYDAYGVYGAYGGGRAHSHSHSHSYTASSSLPRSSGTGGWSLPRSDIRSDSVSRSESRSRSGSRSDEGEESSDEIDADGDDGADVPRDRYAYGYGFSSRARDRGAWKREEDDLSVAFSVREEDEEDAGKKEEQEGEWDGMDMDMEVRTCLVDILILSVLTDPYISAVALNTTLSRATVLQHRIEHGQSRETKRSHTDSDFIITSL